MNAKQMFQECGFVASDCEMQFEKKFNNHEKYPATKFIVFCQRTKEVVALFSELRKDGAYGALRVTIDYYKAISKKLEELGWLDTVQVVDTSLKKGGKIR